MADDLKDNNTKTIEKEELNKQIKEFNSRTFKNDISYIGSHAANIFSILIIILIGVSLIRILYNGSSDTVTLASFLDMLQDVPQVSDSVKNFVQQVAFTEPWDFLDSIRLFLNSTMQVVSILVWMASSLVDVIFFIGFFLTWLFV